MPTAAIQIEVEVVERECRVDVMQGGRTGGEEGRIGCWQVEGSCRGTMTI